MTQSPIRIGLIGAGYIASWHADAIKATPDIELSAICDRAANAAHGLADAYGVRGFASVEDLIAAEVCDAVHILTPPDSHRDLAIQCLNAGLHVLVEKPVALSAQDTQAIEEAAQQADRRFHAGHNFLGLPSYERLKAMAHAGKLGRISSAEVRWCFPLSPLRSGPFGLWLMRKPENLLLEIGPHLFAIVQDLFGQAEVRDLGLSHPIAIPGSGTRPQTWHMRANVRDVELSLMISLVETSDDRSVTLRGSTGRARLDLAADTLIVDTENTADLVANPLWRQLSVSGQHLKAGCVNAARQLTSFNAKSPYGLSFRGMMDGVYGPLTRNAPADTRFSGASAIKVMGALDQALSLMSSEQRDLPAPPQANRAPEPTVMVIGGTGFIGRALTRHLVAMGKDVRVISRGTSGPFADLPDQVETVGLSLSDTQGLTQAMEGIETVYNLARSVDTSWEDCLKHDVAVAEGIGQAALDAGVKRLIYTGTIASYDMSDPQIRITEDTGFAQDMSDRNLYARSKAECERRLLAMHRTKSLPLVIARPGIVVGHGGPLQHWGIGRWHGAGAVKLWGNGRNTLPFVLIDDTVEALARMAETPDIEGESFNIVGAPMMTGRDYFDAIEDAMGARLRVGFGNLSVMFAADYIKHQLKHHVLRRHGLTRPSLADWKSRAHYSPFDNAKACRVLGWHPESNRAEFIRKAITQAKLFGF
ncbi:4-carboxy-2-hydroxymuconate-6-semialdehyde dehydrogenase [Falsiruegeria litorea R37]|uniref:4-carboxy-2-hydroxymuconate-6-semialdehyde dehydrogenase n=1 Tax=Falsiruegeria litorea R37 TaxID=1200284 RepID=A0A1Y5T0V0_9RHOB|nr:NAD-dependent epimerase/dehydratase family protein [Falsiruegeria litorea]SLN53392.1 4-carboxy-2-hydroxymuconate-6-semialdehyde dehydrogenase [Falsiruegeria litorea R37]